MISNLQESKTRGALIVAIATEGDEEIRKLVMADLRRTFKPEFLNRVDDIIVFKALEREQVKSIARLLLDALDRRLQRQAKISLVWTEEALDALAEQGFDPNYGARPLRRLLSHTVETALSKEIIRGSAKEGDTVEIGFADGRFTFRVKQQA